MSMDDKERARYVMFDAVGSDADLRARCAEMPLSDNTPLSDADS